MAERKCPAFVDPSHFVNDKFMDTLSSFLVVENCGIGGTYNGSKIKNIEMSQFLWKKWILSSIAFILTDSNNPEELIGTRKYPVRTRKCPARAPKYLRLGWVLGWLGLWCSGCGGRSSSHPDVSELGKSLSKLV